MGHLSYEQAKKVVFKGFIILGIVTILEVLVALVGKGYIIEGFHLPRSIMYLLMIGMSLYKAYFIVYEFMHMKYEVPGLVKSVLLPTTLLIWAVIAFFTEGHTWYKWRNQVNDRPIAQFSAPKTKHEQHPQHNTTLDTLTRRHEEKREAAPDPSDSLQHESHEK